MLSAVIHVTNFGESPEPAVKSIIASKDRFKEVHFIYPTFQSEEESMYPSWKEDKVQLEGIRILFHILLHAHLLDSDCIIVEIPPNCAVKQGAFNKIQNMMKSVNTKQHTCSLASTSSLPQGSFWVGFFVILQVIESIWNRIFERGKLIEYTDVKAYFLIKKGKIAQFPEAGGYLFNSGVIPKVYSDGTAVLQQQSFASVFEYLMWRLHTHANLKLMGLWIFPYFINYFILAISWPAILRGAIAFDSFYFASYVVLVYVMEIVISYWIGVYYIKTPRRLVYSLLFPLYWALFPWVLIYARLTVPQKTWD